MSRTPSPRPGSARIFGQPISGTLPSGRQGSGVCEGGTKECDVKVFQRISVVRRNSVRSVHCRLRQVCPKSDLRKKKPHNNRCEVKWRGPDLNRRPRGYEKASMFLRKPHKTQCLWGLLTLLSLCKSSSILPMFSSACHLFSLQKGNPRVCISGFTNVRHNCVSGAPSTCLLNTSVNDQVELSASRADPVIRNDFSICCDVGSV